LARKYVDCNDEKTCAMLLFYNIYAIGWVVNIMIRFLHENFAAFASLLAMAVIWLGMNFHSVNGNIKNIDKKRTDRGMAPMAEDEKHIIKSELRSSVITDSIGALIGGIVALVATYIFVV